MRVRDSGDGETVADPLATFAEDKDGQDARQEEEAEDGGDDDAGQGAFGEVGSVVAG